MKGVKNTPVDPPVPPPVGYPGPLGSGTVMIGSIGCMIGSMGSRIGSIGWRIGSIVIGSIIGKGATLREAIEG